MKILVTVKRVTDYEAKLKLTADGSDIVQNGVNMIMNPFDEIAVEEALRIKDKLAAEVVILSVGSKDAEAQIRAAMAMGADRGILVEADAHLNFDSAFLAKIIHKVIEKEKPDLVLMGKQAIDDDNHQTSEMVAELWDVGQATQANTITLEEKEAIVVREADGGLETLAVDLPCVITTDLRLNEPRYASLPGIMKAKKKPLDFLSVNDLQINHKPQVKVKKLSSPETRKAGLRVSSVAELIDKLKTEAKVI